MVLPDQTQEDQVQVQVQGQIQDQDQSCNGTLDQHHHENSASQQLIGQVVHARKCYKRFFFIDLRISDQLKCTVIFRSDDDRQNLPQSLSDLELISRWKKIRRGDTITLRVFEASEDEITKRDHPVYQAADFAVVKAWSGDIPFVSEPAMGFKESTSPQVPPDPPSVNTTKNHTVDSSQPSQQDSWKNYCKFWINSQRCLKKDCQKEHPEGEEYIMIQEMWVSERTKIRKERSKLEDDPHSTSSKVPHSQRAYIFCRWLVNKFGKDLLNSGSGVLDVAGGKGEISLFLTHMFGIRSTVVEPNVRRDKPYQRRNLMHVIRKQLDIEAGGDGQFYKRHAASSSSSLLSDGHNTGVNPAFLEKEGFNGDNQDGYEEDKDVKKRIETSDSTLEKKEQRRLKKLQQAQFVVPRLCTLLDDRFAIDHGSVLESASIIIGMHPDQATEPIVDMALKHHKPFAVVPCCVFAHENPHRRLSTGGEVNTTLEFIQYLMEKRTAEESVGEMQKEFLPFDGMNIVVYSRGGLFRQPG
ncbi:hypothetical protein BGZ54_007562 [Gamsiella multidivaricata]|nr:hypothetical protein BGZ54_007562 [Gamsiella multidivaricata]